MSAAHVAFVVPRNPAGVAAEITRAGGRGRRIPDGVPASILAPVLSGLEGERLEVAFDGNGAAMAADALCRALSETGAPFICVTEGRFDPSMCMPVPGRVVTSVAHPVDEDREPTLPLGFRDAAVDVRTLTAAGIPDAAGLIAKLDPERALSFGHDLIVEPAHA